MGPGVPVDVFADEAKVGFVNKRGGLEGVIGALAAHVGLGEAVEFCVDEREKTVRCVGVSRVHGLQKLGDFS